MMTTRYDDEIRAVETRLEHERAALLAKAEDLGHTARDAAVSPKGLLAAVAIGFLVGEALRPRRQPSNSTKKLGWGGLLGSAAIALVRARYGSPWALGRSAWDAASRQTRQTRFSTAAQHERERTSAM